jgi:hypothetical protein
MSEKDVLVMQSATWMASPSWFLVAGLPWPEDHPDVEVAEAALAIAPDVTQVVRPVGADGKPVPLGHDLALMLDAGSRCASALDKRVLFLSDITRWLADIDLSWEEIGVDFPAAQDELERQSPALLVMVSRMAYTILCSAARTLTLHYASGYAAEVAPEERELVRAGFEAALDADWPGFITQTLASAIARLLRRGTSYKLGPPERVVPDPRISATSIGSRCRRRRRRSPCTCRHTGASRRTRQPSAESPGVGSALRRSAFLAYVQLRSVPCGFESLPNSGHARPGGNQ